MAKYIVHPTKTKDYETNYHMPLINGIAGMVWSVPILQNVFPKVDGIAALGIGAVITLVYVILSVWPVIAVIPCVLSAIVYTTMLWGIADNIGHDVARVIIKIVMLLFVIMVEFCIFSNATVRWLQDKFPEKPRITVIRDEKNN